MKFNPERRHILRWMGLQLALPVLASVVPTDARAAPATRKRFIAVYFPNGSYMPQGADGDWNFQEALAPLDSYRQNTLLLRGLRNGFGGIDPHWQNCAGFLSCHPIQLGDPGVARCAKSLDQHIADAYPSPLRSLEIGGLYYHQHQLNDHPGYSHDYLNRIAWQSADQYRSPVADPARLFEQLFTTQDEQAAAHLQFIRSRKMSILDHLHGDATRLAQRLPQSYRPVLDSYMQTVRELELQIATPTVGCADMPPDPSGDFSSPNTNYVQRFRLMHQMTALAMRCGLTNVATFMYGPSVSDDINFAEEIGPGVGHHGCAHHGGTQSNVDRLKAITQVQVGLLADLLARLKELELLQETLVLYGSDMSDGNIHHTKNLPILLCGEGSDLKFGQELGSAGDGRPLSDLYMDVLSLMGISSLSSFGSGECLSTGQSLRLAV